MVRASELCAGEWVNHEGRVMRVAKLHPVEPVELGPDGQPKLLVLVQEEEEGETTEVVAVASQDFQLEDPPGRPPPRSQRRIGVSAEPGLGAESLDQWTKVVVPKSDEEREEIRAIVQLNAFFAHLEEEEENELIDVVFERNFKADDVLMKEGDMGDLFYILHEGQASIFIEDEDKNQVLVRSCDKGDSFGELALMYDAPRNATVVAKTDLRCWCMDRENFRYVIMGGAIKKQERYMGFVERIEILSTMDKAERLKLVDALIPRKVPKDTVIVRQGDTADMFYIIERGSVVVTQQTPEGKLEKVNDKVAGDYFGEIALMADMPRSATITAAEDAVLLTLDRKTFVSVMGPMEPLLKRNIDLYKTFIDYTSVKL